MSSALTRRERPRDTLPRVAFPLALAALLGLAAPALAQVTPPEPDVACREPSEVPGSDVAPVVAAEQAVCWVERARAAPDADARGPAMAAAARWCERAPLDLGAQVANACFLARVAVGRFEDARRVLPLLSETWPEVERCRRAFERGLVTRVSTTPDGAAVLVDGRSVGRAPVVVELPARFWEARVEARFGRGADVRTVERSGAALLASFDRQTCTLGELEITGPAPSPVVARRALPPVAPSRRQAPRRRARARGRGTAWPGLLVGGAGLVTSAVGATLLGIAAVTTADLRGAPDGTPWTPARAEDYDSAGTLRLAGGVVTGVGITAVAVGVVLLLAHGEGGTHAPPRPR